VSGGQPVKGAAAAGSPRRPLTHYYLAILAALSCALPDTTLIAQTAYRYRDGSGQWVFTDRAANASAPGDTFSLGHENGALHLAIERTDTPESTQLTLAAALDDVRVIATSSLDIRDLVRSSRLHADLHGKLAQHCLVTPPLGRRREDIPLLISHFLEQASEPGSSRTLYSPDEKISVYRNEGVTVGRLVDLVESLKSS